jgi:hypothetical protein
MKYGNTICFCALLIVCLILEIKGIGANGLWVLVVIWAIFGGFDKKSGGNQLPQSEEINAGDGRVADQGDDL